jgi:hypothetical protein
MRRKPVAFVVAALVLLIAGTYVRWRLHQPWSLRDAVLDYEWGNPDVAPSGQVHFKLHLGPDHTGTVTYWEETGGQRPRVWPFRMTDEAYNGLLKRLENDGLLWMPRRDEDLGACAGCDFNELRAAKGTWSMVAKGSGEDSFHAMREAIPDEIWSRMQNVER